MKRLLETFVFHLSITGFFNVSGQRTHDAVPTPCDYKNGGCSSTCLTSTNEEGYSCACPPGIPLLSDKRTCAHEGQSFFLLANRINILKISLDDDTNYTTVELQLDDIVWAMDVDYDPVERHIYWSELNVIRRAYLNGRGQQNIISTDLFLPYGIAIDNIARKLYWSNWGMHRIEMSNLNGANRKVIMREENTIPSTIVVDPEAERIYWMNELTRRIESSSLNEIDRIVIIDTNKGWLTRLVMDYETKIIYWGDTITKKIEMANVDGSNRRILISKDIHSIFGLCLLGEYIYWTDWEKKAIERAHKISGEKRQVIMNDLYFPLNFKAFIIRNVRERTCEPLLPPINGFIIGQSNRSVSSVANFACSSGYRLVGKENTTCLWVHGKPQWSNPTPQCVDITRECYKNCTHDSYGNIIYYLESEETVSIETIHPKGMRVKDPRYEDSELFTSQPTLINAATTVCVNGNWRSQIILISIVMCIRNKF